MLTMDATPRQPQRNSPITAGYGCQDPVLLNEWHVVGFVSDFKIGKLYPLRLLGRDLVAWRDRSGALHVWEDLCIHRGARLSKGSICDDKVVCPYHGWQYDKTAACTLIPAAPGEKPMSKARAFPHKVVERYGFAWVCVGEPFDDVCPYDEWDDDSFVKVHAGPFAFDANAFRALENFLDVTHFPFVHAEVNGSSTEPDKIAAYTVDETAQGALVTSAISVLQPGGDARGVLVRSDYVYTALRPLVGRFRKTMQDIGSRGEAVPGAVSHNATFCTVQMVEEDQCIVRISGALDIKPTPPLQTVVERYNLIFSQDRDIVETQRPERIPADLRYELHHRTDLMGQRYRAWLRSKNISYGVN